MKVNECIKGKRRGICWCELIERVSWLLQGRSAGFNGAQQGQRGQRCTFSKSTGHAGFFIRTWGLLFRHRGMSWLTLWCKAILITATQQLVFVCGPLTEIWHGQEVVGRAGLRSVAEKRMATMLVLFTKAGHYMALDFVKCCSLKLCQLFFFFLVCFLLLHLCQ